MSFVSSLTEAFNKRECSGFTIWPLSDGWLQVNIRSKDEGWSHADVPDLASAIELIENFNDFERRRFTDKPRVPIDRAAKKRELERLARRRRDDDLVGLPAPKKKPRRSDDLI